MSGFEVFLQYIFIFSMVVNLNIKFEPRGAASLTSNSASVKVFYSKHKWPAALSFSQSDGKDGTFQSTYILQSSTMMAYNETILVN